MPQIAKHYLRQFKDVCSVSLGTNAESGKSRFKSPHERIRAGAGELEVLIIKDIVEKCGGNPNQVDDILKPK